MTLGTFGLEEPNLDALIDELEKRHNALRQQLAQERAVNAQLLEALKQVEAEMRGGFGSSFGETREQVRRAIQSAEGRRP